MRFFEILFEDIWSDIATKWSDKENIPLDQVELYINKYKQLKQKNMFDKPEHKDIQHIYKNMDFLEFKQLIDQAEIKANQTKGAIRSKIKNSADMIVYRDDQDWLIIVPKNTETSQNIGTETTWCTSTRESGNRFDDYTITKKGTMVYLINKHEEQKLSNDKSKYAIRFNDETGNILEIENAPQEPHNLPEKRFTKETGFNPHEIVALIRNSAEWKDYLKIKDSYKTLSILPHILDGRHIPVSRIKKILQSIVIVGELGKKFKFNIFEALQNSIYNYVGYTMFNIIYEFSKKFMVLTDEDKEMLLRDSVKNTKGLRYLVNDLGFKLTINVFYSSVQKDNEANSKYIWVRLPDAEKKKLLDNKVKFNEVLSNIVEYDYNYFIKEFMKIGADKCVVLGYATTYNKIDIVKKILKDKNFNIKGTELGDMLGYAARDNHPELVDILLNDKRIVLSNWAVIMLFHTQRNKNIILSALTSKNIDLTEYLNNIISESLRCNNPTVVKLLYEYGFVDDSLNKLVLGVCSYILKSRKRYHDFVKQDIREIVKMAKDKEKSIKK